MSAKFLIVFCAQSALLKLVESQCTHSAIIDTFPQTYISSPFSSCGCPEIIAPAIEATPTTGGTLPVTCLSTIPEEPITVISENVYEGTLSVNGELPFVSTVSVSGELPTAGIGAVNHACGSSAGITKEFFSSGVGNSFVPTKSIDYKRGLSNAFVAPASEVFNLGRVNVLRPAVGSGNARYGVSNVGPITYGVGDIANFVPSANAIGNVGFRSAGVGNIGYGINSVRSPGYGGVGVTNTGYGGIGESTVAVVGEIPVAGTTVVVGQLPVVGAVCFNGPAPAFGTVTVSGSCSCDFNKYMY